MTRPWLFVIFVAVLTAAIFLQSAGASEAEDIYRVATERDYDDVFEDIEFAVTEHNFRLTGGNHIGSAISARGFAPFPRSDIIHFCNLEYARQFLLAAPDYLLNMPCKIVMYEADGKIIVEARLLDESDARVVDLARQVNSILQSIVDYATNE